MASVLASWRWLWRRDCIVASAGDLIMTGTPAGVGPVVAGDRMTAACAAVPGVLLTVDVTAP